MSRLSTNTWGHPQYTKRVPQRPRAGSSPGRGKQDMLQEQPGPVEGSLARRHPEVQAVKATGEGKQRQGRVTLGGAT